MNKIHPAEMRVYLKEHNISQNKAAELCSINPRRIREMIAGKRPIPSGVFELLKLKVEIKKRLTMCGGRDNINVSSLKKDVD